MSFTAGPEVTGSSSKQATPVCIVIAGLGGLGVQLLEKMEKHRTWRDRPIGMLIAIDYFSRPEKKAALEKRLAANFARVLVLHWDASQLESTKALARELGEGLAAWKNPFVDAALITTGIGYHGTVQGTSMERTDASLQKLLQVNCTGPALLSQLLVTKFMRKAPNTNTTTPGASSSSTVPPTILFMSSASGLMGLPERAAYCASKFALNGWAESLYADLPHLRIVLVCPTTVDTNFRDNWKKQLKEEGQPASASASSSPAAGGPAASSPGRPAAPPLNAIQQAAAASGPSLWQRFTDGKTRMTVAECVDGIWNAFNKQPNTPGVKYVVMKGIWTEMAAWTIRTPFLGAYTRYRVLLKASRL